MSTPYGAMLGPVPLVALPRRALANVRAASAICAAGTPDKRCDALRGERSHGRSQRFESLRFRCDETAVLQALGEDHVEHGGQQFDVVTRQALQVDVGLARRLGDARVDDDQLEAAARAPRAVASQD